MEMPRPPIAPSSAQPERDVWEPNGEPVDMEGKLMSAFGTSLHKCPYVKGAVVTPKPNRNLRGVGRPMLVMSVYEEKKITPVGEGNRVVISDMVVGVELDGLPACFEVHSADYEAFTK